MEGDQHYREETTTRNIDIIEDIEISVMSKEQDNSIQRINEICNYQPHTLQPNSLTGRQRCLLLPAYPTHKYDARSPLLLLANVMNIDRDLLKKLTFPDSNVDDDDNDMSDRHKQNIEYCPFQFQLNLQHEFLDSFLIDFYQKLYMNTSQQWKISFALIDYNLSRLQKCMNKYSRQVGNSAIALIDELSMALEFYLQIDVDLFFMKTCDYRDAQPRLIGKQQEKEGIFCELPPSARYGTTQCRQRRCFLCEPQQKQDKSTDNKNLNETSKIMTYSEQQTHRFVNHYQAILNCPANCYTENVIYALTCPCGEYDYIGSTAQAFNDRISEHREEGHRIIREFLIGPKNIDDILNQDKRKIEPLANQYDLLLYQHSARCQFGLERFVRKNPHYWCFIPQLSRHVKLDDDVHLTSMKTKENKSDQSISMQPFADATLLAAKRKELTSGTTTPTVTSQKPMLFASIVADMTRSDEETIRLLRQVPDSPVGYKFSIRQREEQNKFFQTKRDNAVYPSDFVDLYNYTIVAVLPIDCSRDLRKFIEALFITHAETKLNMIGRLTHEHSIVLFDDSLRGQWCSNLIHPLFRQ